jgi:predicted ATPase/class 3 adenylate cyclase
MPDLPTGTVTFLFTDVEGSTRLLERQPAAYRDAVRQHHDLLREAVEAHGGAVFETVGDAVYAAFAQAPDAVAAALAGQLAMRAGPWAGGVAPQVRMGLHSGGVDLQGAHYFGVPLYRGARLTAAAHGGQVVLSLATAELMRDALPAGASLHDLGEQRLRDLQRPERVFQLLHPDLAADFPPLRSLDTLPNNLPLQLTSFVGREREVAEVAGRLAGGARLVALVGVGGTGKTRLALQAAAQALDSFVDGVWLIELAPLSDPALVPQAVAAVLGVREDPGRALLATLSDALRPKRLLLVLDNCEHLIEACAGLADALLRACPRLQLLATSREALGIAGETPYQVPSLALPPVPDGAGPARGRAASGGDAEPPVEALTQYEAVKLFIERAATVRPDFAVTRQNAPAIAQLCYRLDGIPLALELAAARLKVLPVEQLLGRLEDRFRLLTGGSRTALPRQQTLQATVAWSYELLSGEERTLFNRLSAFAGGWTLEAAEAVGAGEGIEAWAVLDLLARLVDKSLVVMEEAAGGTARYRLLETLRQFGRERLAESGESAAVRDRHLAWALALGERAAPELRGPRLDEWLDRLEGEIDNVRAALYWAADGGSVEQGLRLASALEQFWFLRAHVSEVLELLTALLSRPPATRTGARAAALMTAARCRNQLGEPEAEQRQAEAAEGLAIAREVGDAHTEALALFWLSANLRRSDPELATSRLEQALAAFRTLGDRWWTAVALYGIGNVLVYAPDGQAQARTRYEESLALWRETGDPWGISRALSRLGFVAREAGEAAAARPLFEESLALCRQIGDRHGIGWTLMNLGDVAADLGEHALARRHYAESLATWLDYGYRVGVAGLLRRLADLAAAQSQPERVMRLAGAAARERELRGGPYSTADQARHEAALAVARQALGEAAATREWEAGRAMALDEAIALALEETSDH